MAAQILPQSIRQSLATLQMRTHHLYWHSARAWNDLNPKEKADLRLAGYTTLPIQMGEPGAGIDFLGMHRTMIEQINHELASLGDPGYPRVSGWNPIPFQHNDPDYPMPPVWLGAHQFYKDQKSQGLTDFYRNEVAAKFENDTWYSGRELDEIGTEIEGGIHVWFHLHWSAQPWYVEGSGKDKLDIRNDFLGDPFSSHVNSIFWKLHGWIDDRISQWERVNGRQADFSNVWHGPHHHMHEMLNKRTDETVGEPVPESLLEFSRSFFVRTAKVKR